MTEKLIALVDGSSYARSVCGHAAWIARRSGLAVEVLHVLGRREAGAGSDLSGSIALGARSALLEQLSELDEQRSRLAIQRGRAILEDAREILQERGVSATEQLRHGDLVEAVSEREVGAEMVVVGKRGEGADFAKGHLGSNLERVMRATRKSLFVASRAFREIEKVLVAYDGSASAMRAIDYVARSPLYTGLHIKVVTAGTELPETTRALSDVKATLQAAGLEVETETRAGQPEEALARLVEDEGFDHLVMGASGHSRLRSLFVGSTSLEMARTCRVPIMLVK